MSNFYRLYVDGCRYNVLLNADNMADALRLTSMCICDETVCNVKVVYTHERCIDLEEVRSCDIISFGEKGGL